MDYRQNGDDPDKTPISGLQVTCDPDIEVLPKLLKHNFIKASLMKFLIQNLVGRAGFEPAKFSQQIYSLPSLAA